MNLGNVLVFGGTGMLAEATSWIAGHSASTTAFGRDNRKLDHLANTYGVKTEVLDYTDLKALKEQIDETYRKHGVIHLVVAWIHNTSPDAVSVIQETIFNLQPFDHWTLLIVKGSSRLSDVAEALEEAIANCSIKVVKLGFFLTGNTSRWLTHKEISGGVIEAIKSGNNETIVGTLEPWDMRP